MVVDLCCMLHVYMSAWVFMHLLVYLRLSIDAVDKIHCFCSAPNGWRKRTHSAVAVATRVHGAQGYCSISNI